MLSLNAELSDEESRLDSCFLALLLDCIVQECKAKCKNFVEVRNAD